MHMVFGLSRLQSRVSSTLQVSSIKHAQLGHSSLMGLALAQASATTLSYVPWTVVPRTQKDSRKILRIKKISSSLG